MIGVTSTCILHALTQIHLAHTHRGHVQIHTNWINCKPYFTHFMDSQGIKWSRTCLSLASVPFSVELITESQSGLAECKRHQMI